MSEPPPASPFERVDSLALYSAIYLVLLGATYALLPYPVTGAFPAWPELRGSAYVAAGLLLLWSAIGVLPLRYARLACGSGAALIILTAIEFVTGGASGTGVGHGLQGVALLLLMASPYRWTADSSRYSLLGIVLAGNQLGVGIGGLVRPSTLPAIPPLHLAPAAVGALFVITAAPVLLVSLDLPRYDRFRAPAHLLAALGMLVVQVGVSLTLGPLIFATFAASLFRTAVTAFLPQWERRVQQANARTLRARFAVAAATVAIVAGFIPALAALGVGDTALDNSHPRRLLTYWAVILAGFFAAIAGIAFARAARAALDRALGRSHANVDDSDFNVVELQSVAVALNERAEQVSVLQRHISEHADQIGGLGHDLRNPLTVIMGAGSLLEQRADDEQRVRRVARMVRTNAARMLGLVENLVDAVRTDTGQRVRSTPTRVHVPTLLEQLTSHYQLTEQAGRLTCAAVDASVTVDQLALLRVITNLVDNALKYSTGMVDVIVERSEQEVTIAVADHGPGIRREHQERVFQRYYQATAGSGPRTGFGLGLYIARHLIAAEGGRITLRDTPGGGATFVISLPASARVSPDQVGSMPLSSSAQ